MLSWSLLKRSGKANKFTDETMMTIHFNADLRPVVKERVGMLHWVLDPEVSGFIIGYDLSDNQVLICGFDVFVFPYLRYDHLN